MFQNFYGCFLRTSGNINCRCARASLQLDLNSWYAACVFLCFLPCYFLHALYSLFASLHLSLYHGARCFSHRLGLTARRFVRFCTTPIFSACSIRYSSILDDRSVLSCLNSSMMFVNAAANSSDEVCLFHSWAFSIYFAMFLSPIHSMLSSFYAGVYSLLVVCVLVVPR
jgi:hypothetical protein